MMSNPHILVMLNDWERMREGQLVTMGILHFFNGTPEDVEPVKADEGLEAHHRGQCIARTWRPTYTPTDLDLLRAPHARDDDLAWDEAAAAGRALRAYCDRIGEGVVQAQRSLSFVIDLSASRAALLSPHDVAHHLETYGCLEGPLEGER